MKQFTDSLNVAGYCRKYNVELWSCPPFLFIVMGVVIISVVLVTYNIGQNYTDPLVLALIILVLAAFLLLVSFVIMGAFERVVHARVMEAEKSKQLVKLKDQFVFVAAHELRTPATAIKWGIDVMKTQQPEIVEKSRVLFNIIETSNNRLLRLVKDMLLVARIESETIKVELKKLSLIDVVTGSIDENQTLAYKKEVTIHNEINKTLPMIKADDLRIKEVFDILIKNAVNYNSKGGTVWVRAEERDSEVLVQIVDTGMGIQQDNRVHIFEKFWRSDQAQVEVDGSGLGLFIAKQLVEIMGGELWFSSESGKGTTFSLTLKRAE